MTSAHCTTERRPNGAAFIIAAGLAALGGLLVWQGRGIPDKGGYGGIGSGDIPQIIGWALLALAVAHIITGLRKGGMARPHQEFIPVLWIVGGLALQLILLKPVGFSIASSILFACTAAAFGKRNLALTLPIGIIFTLVVYGIFDLLLQLNLPAELPETLLFGG